MKRYTSEDLPAILAAHKLWGETDGEEGIRADLSGADLSGMNLDGASLDGASLRRASLVGASLDGASLVGASLVGALGGPNILCIGPIGSRNAYTTYWIDEDRVQCGCWMGYRGGSVDEFEELVRARHTGKHLAEYLAAITLFRAIREAQPAKGEATQTEQVIA